jgi:hypothetical protein
MRTCSLPPASNIVLASPQLKLHEAGPMSNRYEKGSIAERKLRPQSVKLGAANNDVCLVWRLAHWLSHYVTYPPVIEFR